MGQNYEDCNHRFQKILEKAEKEISKVNEFCKNYNTVAESVTYDLTKDEKRKMIESISESSRTCRILIEELKMHRTEVKCLLSAYDKLTHKYERLKMIQQDQLKKIDNIHKMVSDELIPIINTQELNTKADKEKNDAQQEENKELEETFRKIETKISKLIDENNEEIEQYDERIQLIKEENSRDKIIFCLVSKYIKKAFEIQAKLKSKNVKLVDYAFSETELAEDSPECCCCEQD